MSTIKRSFRNNYAVLEINRPKAHALNLALVNDLRQAFQDIRESENVAGVVLTAGGNIFCAGLDLVELYDYDEAAIDEFWKDFHYLIRDMAGFPKPLVAAVNGHAPAGGCVLALCCDYRMMAEGKGRIGLNEVPVGVVLPSPVVELARFALGDARAADMIYHGALLLPPEAGGFGLVHATAPQDALLEKAEEKLQSWLALPQEPWQRAKATLRAPLLRSMDVDFGEGYGETIHHWWSAESRSTVGKMVEKLQSKT